MASVPPSLTRSSRGETIIHQLNRWGNPVHPDWEVDLIEFTDDRPDRPGAITAIILDFGRVISAPKPAALFRGYEQELGLAPGALNRIMFDSPAWQAVLVGRQTIDEYWREIGPQLGLPTPPAIAAFRRRYHADEAINQGVLDLIRRLHGHYKLAVLSNAPAGLDRWLADWGLLDLFDLVFCSAEEGVVKPDPAAFQRVLARLGVQPGAAVFIDDTIGHVEAARRLGLHGIHFGTVEALAAELEALLADCA